jgi:hypothetical protein
VVPWLTPAEAKSFFGSLKQFDAIDADLYRESSKQVHNHRDFSTGSPKAMVEVMKCIPQVCPPFEQGPV